MSYSPNPPPQTGNFVDLANYLYTELQQVSGNFATLESGLVVPRRYVTEKKPRDSLMTFADGASWDPGQGRGLYVYDDSIPGYVQIVADGGRGGPGWKDEKSNILVRGVGVNDPTWKNIGGNFWGYAFDPGTMNQCWIFTHIDHNYCPGTSVYPHIHWVPKLTNSGTVRWGFEWAVAKGHNQEDFNFASSTTFYVEQAASNASLYRHYIGEASDGNAIPGTSLEPDSVIALRIFRDATHVNDTYTGDAFAFFADVHYKVRGVSTKNKAPNFYV